MRKKTLVTMAVVLAVVNSGLFALTGTEISRRAHDIDAAETIHAAVKMELISANGDIDTRVIEEWSSDANDLSSTLMVFRSPASVANTRFLQKENNSRDDDKWMYLPALRRVRRIASSDGEKSFMGTDMTYDDMEVREIEQDTHELLGEEKIGSWDCYKVKTVSIDPDDSQYGYRMNWIDKESFYPVKIEMYDKSEELLKVLEVEELKEISGVQTPMSVLLSNVQTNHSTRISMVRVVYDEPINPRLFTTSYLEQGR
ncbi:MAG: outer membrane lipoprotein-sorting protein [Spirochaetales bacterium]|nr:outer membrane lipoprotein-sorting protein [Spirochaetales bacterium]